MATLRQHVFVVVYTLGLLLGLAALWFRPSVTDWPAWVQAVGSILAILAAIGIAQWQASRERRKEDELRERRERAARAVTPLALTQICDWATRTIGLWREAARRIGVHDHDADYTTPRPADLVFPKVPEGAIRDIQAMIEASSATSAKAYVALLQVIQVQQSRGLDFSGRVGNPDATLTSEYCRVQVVEAAGVYARASDLFDHARDQAAEDETAVARREISRALFLSGTYESLFPDIAAIADRRFGLRDAPEP